MSLFGPPDIVKLESRKRVGRVRNALSHADSEIRLQAAAALGRLKDIKSVPRLVVALEDEDDAVCANAASALGEMGDTRAIEPLVVLLGARKRWFYPFQYHRVSRAAANALSKLKWRPRRDRTGAYYWIAKGKLDKCTSIGVHAIGPLIEVWNNAHTPGAAHALGAIGNVRVIAPLIAKLGDDSFEGREAVSAAREALVQVGGSAVEPLIETFENGNFSARFNAEFALGGIGNARAITYLIATLGKTEFADHGLVTAGKPAVEPLIEAFENGSDVVRSHAAYALGGIGDARAVEPLIRALVDDGLRDTKSASRTLYDIVCALGEIGDTRALEPMMTLLSDIDTEAIYSVEVVRVLSNFRDPLAIAPLIKTLSVNDEDSIGKSDYHRSVAKAVKKLSKRLESGMNTLPQDDLEFFAGLPLHYRYMKKVAAEFDVPFRHVSSKIDYVVIKQLARQELIKRGKSQRPADPDE